MSEFIQDQSQPARPDYGPTSYYASGAAPNMMIGYGALAPTEAGAEGRIIQTDVDYVPQAAPAIEVPAQSELQPPVEQPAITNEQYISSDIKRQITPQELRKLRIALGVGNALVDHPAESGVVVMPVQESDNDAQVSTDVYRRISANASKVIDGTFDPVFVKNEVMGMISSLPDADPRKLLLQQAATELDVRYAGSAAAAQIKKILSS